MSVFNVCNIFQWDYLLKANDNDQKFIQTEDRMKYPKSVAKGNESAAGELGYSIFIKSFF